MAFIRIKRAKRKNGKICEYAYICENRRYRKKKVKQKTKKYLGRVYRFDRTNVMDFFEYYKISDIDQYLDSKRDFEIVLDLVKLELFNHGFEKIKDNIWKRKDCICHLKNKKITNKRGSLSALAFNEGYLTGHVLRKLINFQPVSEKDGYDFAKMFVEAGINIPKEVFIGLFRKFFK